MRYSQKNEIREFLEAGNSITSVEAFSKFGATRLSAIIYDLKNIDGLDIKAEYVTEYNEHGSRTRYAVYSLGKVREY